MLFARLASGHWVEAPLPPTLTQTQEPPLWASPAKLGNKALCTVCTRDGQSRPGGAAGPPPDDQAGEVPEEEEAEYLTARPFSSVMGH